VLREPALFVLAIILMLSFSLFPKGYMPARTASGYTIVLCTAAGLSYKSVDAPQKPRHHIGSERCDLISAAAVLPPTTILPAPPETLSELSLWSVRAFTLRFRAVFDPNAPPTAPPLRML
jgi:hypothetical protein